MSSDQCTEELNSILDTKARFDAFVFAKQVSLNSPTQQSLSQIQALNTEITNVAACLSQKSGERAGIPNKINQLQTDILNITAAMESDREALEISKARTTYIDEARRPVSHYESWFPVGRPLKPLTMLLLVGFTAFLAILGAVLLFGSFGINLMAERVAPTNRVAMWLLSLGYPFWISLVLFIVFLSLYLNK